MIPRVKVNYGWRDLFRAAATLLGAGGDECGRLTNLLAERFGTRHLVLTPSGRGGLHLLLSTLPHRRVVIPAYTCKAVAEAALLAGKEVAFVETELDSFNTGPDGLAPQLDSDTVFIATHQFGIPCDIAALARICRERGAVLIEDCAAALGTRIAGKLTGTFGDAAFFSFDSTKLINVPLKAGFVIVRDGSWFARVRERSSSELQAMPLLHQLRLLTLACAYLLLEHPALYGIYHSFTLRERFTADSATLCRERTAFYRYAVTRWQAGIALPQIARLEEIIHHRRECYARYRRELAGCRHLALPPEDAAGEWACIRFPVVVRQGDKLAWYRAATARGVDFAFSFTFLASPAEFTRAHEIARGILDLPFYEKLTAAALAHTVATLREIDAERPTPASIHARLS